MLTLSPDTVLRDWRLAKAWLAREMSTTEAMTPDRWKKIEEVYHSAREREGSQRIAFLIEACAGDEALRREIESLLV